MIREQKLVTVRIEQTESGEAITLSDGKAMDDLLSSWRIVGMETLGPRESGYAALLLVEELPPESRGGRLGFAIEGLTE
jgi:hypothetical protein